MVLRDTIRRPLVASNDVNSRYAIFEADVAACVAGDVLEPDAVAAAAGDLAIGDAGLSRPANAMHEAAPVPAA